MKLVNTNNFDSKFLKFSSPEENNIPASKLKFKRIRIMYDDKDSIGDLILQSPSSLLSWGIQEQTDMNSGVKTGYTLPITLFSKEGATEEQEHFVEVINQITNTCKEHLVEHRHAIEKHDLELADLKRLNPLYWKRTDNGQLDTKKGPTLYAKTMYGKKDDEIYTTFIDESLRTDVDPKQYLNKHMYTSFALKVESIFIGNTISLQLKLKEVKFTLKDSTLRSLLDPSIVLSGTSSVATTKEEAIEEEVEEYLEEEEEVEVEEVDDTVEDIVVEEEIPIIKVQEEVVKPKPGKTSTRKKKGTPAISVN